MASHYDPDRWQAALPEPFNFLNQILQETLDDVLLELTLKEEVARIENIKPKPDDESGAVVLGATFTYALPAELDKAGADSVLEPIAEGVYAVALASGALWLWSLSGQVPPLQIGTAGAGLTPCVLACTPLPASSGPPARKRLVMLSAKPEPPPDVNVNAGPEDAQLLAFDLTPPVLGTTTTWTVAPVGAFKLAALGRARATLSSDGRFCACVLRDCSVAVYHLPLPPPVPPPPAEGGAKLGAKAAAPAPAPAAPPPFLLLTVPAQAAGPPASVGCHFVLAPAPRSLGAALSWQACGLLSWGEGGSKLLQTVLPSASALAAKGAAAATSTSATLEWRLPGALTASAASADSVLIATGLDEGSVVLWDTNVRSDRYVLQRHGAAVTQLALHGAQLCISYAADFTLHGYDVSADPETGQGKLTFRRRLEHGMEALWLAIGAQLPLVLLGSPDAIRIFDMQGDLLTLFNPHAAAARAGLSGGAALLTARPGPCALLLSSQHYSVSCLAMPATAPSLTMGAEAKAPQLACLSLSAALLATYPHLPGLVGGEVPVPLLATLLKSYTHAQRQDAQLMAAAPLLVQGGTLGGSTKGGGSRTKKGGGLARRPARQGRRHGPLRRRGRGFAAAGEPRVGRLVDWCHPEEQRPPAGRRGRRHHGTSHPRARGRRHGRLVRCGLGGTLQILTGKWLAWGALDDRGSALCRRRHDRLLYRDHHVGRVARQPALCRPSVQGAAAAALEVAREVPARGARAAALGGTQGARRVNAAARDAAGSRRAPAAAQEQVIARTRQRASPRTPRQRLRDLCALELHF